MEYNTEMIEQLGQQVTEIFKIAMDQQLKNGETGMPIADIETEFRKLLQQIGAQALSQFLSLGTGTTVAEIPCKCGGTLYYQRLRPATITSVFGKIAYERAYYAGCTCGHGKAPVDEQYGLEPGAISSGLADLLGLAGIEFGFDESRKWLKSFLLFDVSENTVRSETERFGALQAERENVLCGQSQEEEYLQARLRDMGRLPTRLYGSLDGAKVRIEPRQKAGRKPENEEDWRDMKVGCWYEAELVPSAQRSTRQRDKFSREQSVLRAKNMRYYCDILEAEAFGKLLWGTGCAVKADLVRELVFVCDGAVWIWNLVDYYYPQAVQIVDWYHAVDHLKKLAQVAFPSEQERAQWLEWVTNDLWEGRVEAVIDACRGLTRRCEDAKAAVTYFTNNEQRMKYDQFRSAGYLIGSGTVESACKQIVTQRLKKPGAQWNVEGAVSTAKARAAWLSGEWDFLRIQRAALPLAI